MIKLKLVLAKNVFLNFYYFISAAKQVYLFIRS